MLESNKRNYRLVAIFVLFALMSAQISISVHSINHPDHGFSVASNHIDTNKKQDHSDGQHHKDKCPICLLAQTLQNGLSTDSLINFDIILPAQDIVQSNVTTPKTVRFRLYASRAPPTFLI